MRLADILKPENVKLPLSAVEKTAAIEELVELLDTRGEINDRERVRRAVLDREATRSTGIGDGLAIPHGKTDGVDQLVMAVGRAADPIEFGSIDGKPVTLIWLLASPTESTSEHITALGRISKIMSNPAVRRRLMSATTAREMYDFVIEHDERT